MILRLGPNGGVGNLSLDSPTNRSEIKNHEQVILRGRTQEILVEERENKTGKRKKPIKVLHEATYNCGNATRELWSSRKHVSLSLLPKI
jgi:hypothetical protein